MHSAEFLAQSSSHGWIAGAVLLGREGSECPVSPESEWGGVTSELSLKEPGVLKGVSGERTCQITFKNYRSLAELKLWSSYEQDAGGLGRGCHEETGGF